MRNMGVSTNELASMKYDDIKNKYMNQMMNQGRMITEDLEKEAGRLAEQDIINAADATRRRVIQRLQEDITPEMRAQKKKLEEIQQRQEVRKRRMQELLNEKDMMSMLGNLALNTQTKDVTMVPQESMPSTAEETVEMEETVMDPTKRRRIRGGGKKRKQNKYALFSFL